MNKNDYDMKKATKLRRSQFTFFASFHEALIDLDDCQYGRLMRAICEFALYGDEPEFNDIVEKMAWKLIMPILQSGRNKVRDCKRSANEPQTNRKLIANEPQTESNPSKDKDMDMDMDKEKEKDSSSGVSATDDYYQKFMDWYNDEIKYTTLQKISVMTHERKTALDTAKKAIGSEKIAAALARARESDYLMGNKKDGRKMSLEWFLCPDNITKILEGYYDN